MKISDLVNRCPFTSNLTEQPIDWGSLWEFDFRHAQGYHLMNIELLLRKYNKEAYCFLILYARYGSDATNIFSRMIFETFRYSLIVGDVIPVTQFIEGAIIINFYNEMEYMSPTIDLKPFDTATIACPWLHPKDLTPYETVKYYTDTNSFIQHGQFSYPIMPMGKESKNKRIINTAAIALNPYNTPKEDPRERRVYIA